MTEKLYEKDSHLAAFTATVTACRAQGSCWEVALDRTAFFPEGGGQSADTGRIGQVSVLDVHEREDGIWHRTDAALEVGAQCACALDWEQRLRRMQNHSGEHIFSGLAHTLFGAENTGFHMGTPCMTVDLSCEIAWEGLMEIETRANEAVRANLPVRVLRPDAAELRTLSYRSKLARTENVRIVEIEGVDRCACCAPHVSHTGEIGLIKVLDAQRHRGGVRVSLVCGTDALACVRVMQQNVTAAARLLSAPREGLQAAVERVLEEQHRQKERIAQLGMANARLLAASVAPREGNLCVFDDCLDEAALRELVNLLSEKCTGYAAAFSGSDAGGYRYIIGSRHVDLRAAAKMLNAALSGRGGGTPEMIQGRALRSRDQIREFVEAGTIYA